MWFVTGYSARKELLKHVGEGIDSDADGCVLHDLCVGVTVSGWVVVVGDEAGENSADDTRIAELGFSVVTLADDRTADGVEEARAVGAGAFIEVAWVLLEDGGERNLFNHQTGAEVRVGGAVAFRVALRTLSEAFVRVLRLPASGDNPVDYEGGGVEESLPSKFVSVRANTRLTENSSSATAKTLAAYRPL